jgi:hypothetical protein
MTTSEENIFHKTGPSFTYCTRFSTVADFFFTFAGFASIQGFLFPRIGIIYPGAEETFVGTDFPVFYLKILAIPK